MYNDSVCIAVKSYFLNFVFILQSPTPILIMELSTKRVGLTVCLCLSLCISMYISAIFHTALANSTKFEQNKCIQYTVRLFISHNQPDEYKADCGCVYVSLTRCTFTLQALMPNSEFFSCHFFLIASLHHLLL